MFVKKALNTKSETPVKEDVAFKLYERFFSCPTFYLYPNYRVANYFHSTLKKDLADFEVIFFEELLTRAKDA
jgi:sulfatase maturation enzyme AslB (radical SAM superfamily)